MGEKEWHTKGICTFVCVCFCVCLWQRKMEGEKEKKRIKKAQKQKEAERKMTCLLVKAGNCLKCQPIVYQRGKSTYSSYHSLPAATLCLSLIPSSGTPATALLCFSITITHTCTRAHVHTDTHTRVPCSSTSMSQRPRCPIRRQWRGDTVFAQARLTDSTSPASQAPNTPIISCPPNQCNEDTDTDTAIGQKVQEKSEIVVKKGKLKGERRGRRRGMEREKWERHDDLPDLGTLSFQSWSLNLTERSSGSCKEGENDWACSYSIQINKQRFFFDLSRNTKKHRHEGLCKTCFNI